MRRGGGIASGLSVLISAALLLWPAALNGYPLLFGDTGVYLGDGIHLHMSWARPLFYGLFMLPLHLKITTWPVIIVQALIAATVLLAVLRAFIPGRQRVHADPCHARAGGRHVAALVCLAADAGRVRRLDAAGARAVDPGPVRLRAWAALALLAFASACITTHLSFLPVVAGDHRRAAADPAPAGRMPLAGGRPAGGVRRSGACRRAP